MLHRIRKKNDENYDKWIGVGGKFEEGESPYDCVRREIDEETGYKNLIKMVSLAFTEGFYVKPRVDDELLSEVQAKSAYIFEAFAGKPGIKSVSGLGLMIGIETEGDSSAILKACMERGILPIKAKTKIRLLPALNIPWEDLKAAVEIIAEEAEKAL